MGWRPTVGVLLPYVGGCYFTPLLAGIQRVARRRGARVVAFQTTGMELCWPAEGDTSPLAWDRIDGWIGISDAETTAHYQRIAAGDKPLVTLSTRLPGHPSCAVLPDNREGVTQAVRHLLEHGHRRIAFAGALNHPDIRERYEAYIGALHDGGIAPDSSLFFSCGSLVELDGRAIGRQLSAARLPCTAIVAGTDALAIGIVDAVQGAGYRVPQDLAITGFDDIERAQYTNPPLTTVHLPFEVLAEKTAEVLLARLLDGTPLPEIVRVPGTLIPRHSCGCTVGQRQSRPVSSHAAQEGDAARFTRALLDVAGGGRTLDELLSSEIRPHAAKIAAHLGAVVRGETGMPATDIRDSWQNLLAIAHEVETVETLLSLVEETATAWLRAVGPNGPAEHSLHPALRSLRFELMRAWRVVEQTRRHYADSNADANRKINLALIGVDLASMPALSWLRWTRLRHAVFGEWRAATATAARRLCIRSAFHAGPEPFPLIGSEHLPAEFPTPALCDLLDDANANDIMSVVPIAGRGQNRGLLAVVGPIEIELTEDTGNLELWAALLGAAMDREELMATLRLAFEREREFAETLRQSEERYALAAHGANDGLWDWDVASGRVYLSARWKSMLGNDEHEIGSHVDAWFSRVHEDDLPGLKEALEAPVSGRKTHIQHEYRMVHKDGRHVWVLCRGIVVFDSRGNPVRVAGSQTDITASKEAEEQLRRSVLHDALTGLPNRALLMDRLEQAIVRAQRTAEARFAVLFLDLDHFKTLNDSLGHLAGDQLLVQIASRLGECLSSTDTVARLGGDEFAIILTDLENDETASIIAERIQEALGEPFALEGHRVFTSASVGITLSSEKYKRAADFLRDADTAMYRAKSQGRARHQLFDGQMHEQAMERLSVEAGVRRALERDELVLYYQPIVSLDAGNVVGVEALIRWNHPDRGILAPAEFLAVAEESGLILPISEWVVRSACEQARLWQRLQPMRISVNMPPQQLKHPSFVKLISNNLRRSALSPSAIGLELVESSLIENREAIVDNLRELRAMGVYVAVDDFGTGYSSLSYLKRLPIDALKIDRSFTQGIPSDPNDTAISTTIIAMARSLNLQVVAEGVETREQVEFLRAHGCHTAQGYFFSRPLPAEECLQFLEQGRQLLHLSSRPPPSSRARGTGTK
ncbi:MAG TPA: EAL domain-containing protein [Polyangiaceae bacterium]|nr:EAL domain-containing protein [Polyangiaceae bacterium]